MTSSVASRLGLGTVQFGLRYGVANRTGQVQAGQAAEMLAVARDAGMDTIDTAAAYGESEAVLGALGVSDWRVVSKAPPLVASESDVGAWLHRTVRMSIERLGVSRLHGLLLHRSADLLDPRGRELYAALQELKQQGLVRNIGVSIYGPDELEKLSERFRFDLVQAPFNIADRRIDSSGWLERLVAAGVEVHTRSAFLQGLLLMDDRARPAYFDTWRPFWQRWRSWLSSNDLSPVQACLAFALATPRVGRVIVGADSVQQLKEMIEIVGRGAPLPPADLSSTDIDLLNPSRWQKT